MVDPTVMFKHHYGLYIISSKTDEGYAACLINTATQVTADPIQVIVSVNKQNVTCGRIQSAGHFALAIVDESADMPFIGRFGFRSSADIDKFEGLPTSYDEFGDPYTTEHTCGMVSCGHPPGVPRRGGRDRGPGRDASHELLVLPQGAQGQDPAQGGELRRRRLGART